MTIHPQRPPTFTCAICTSEIFAGPSAWNWPIPPLCRSCEQGGEWATAYSWRYRFRRETNPDKRILSQIRALADQLHFEASNHVRT
jgi:hypothetical protein